MSNPAQPASLRRGRYQGKQFLGAGSKKGVYLAGDRVLDRDVAMAVIKPFLTPMIILAKGPAAWMKPPAPALRQKPR